MTPRPRARVALAVLSVLAVMCLAAPVGAAEQGTTSGPALSLDQSSVNPGDRVTIIFVGWQGRTATVSVCGNLAKRGSADCNMIASQDVRLYHIDKTPITSFVVSVPPGTCPCVLRSSSDLGEVAYSPIEIRGVEIGPVIDPFADEPPFDVSMTVEANPDSIGKVLRSWLGGSTAYVVNVEVRNKTSEQLGNVAVRGTVGQNETDVLDEFEFEPGAIGPGQTWSGTAQVDLPAPVIGTYNWRVLASGAGPVTETSSSTRAVPWLLIALVLLLVGDVVAVVVRWFQRRPARRAAAGDPPAGESAGPVDPTDPLGPQAEPPAPESMDADSPRLVSSPA